MTRIQLRRDTSTNWATYNPVPAQGEPCYETDTGKLKIGNGEQPYNDLSYQDSGTSDYTQLTNKPQINGVELTGNQDGTTLGLANSSEIEELGNELNQLTNDVTNLDSNTAKLNESNTFTQQQKMPNIALDNELYLSLNSYVDGAPFINIADNKAVMGKVGSDLFLGNSWGNFWFRVPNAGFIRRVTPSDSGGYRLFDEGNITDFIDGTSITWNGSRLSATSTAPTNMVTTDTVQTITGAKTFSGGLTVPNTTILNTSTITCPSGNNFSINMGSWGNAGLLYTNGNTYFLGYSTKTGTINASSLTLDTSTCTIDSTSTVTIKSTNNTNGAVNISAGNGSTTGTINLNAGSVLINGQAISTNESVTNLQNAMGNLKYWTGTEADYTGLASKDADTLYRTTNTNKVFLGTIQLGGNT